MRVRLATFLSVALTVLMVSLVQPPGNASESAEPVGPAEPSTSSTQLQPGSGLAAPARSAAGSSPQAIPVGYSFRELQLNLCNSGFAGCYAGGESVPEAAAIISEQRPDLVTLNEVCEGDVRDRLWPGFRTVWGSDWTFWAFMPAGDRSTGGAYLCKNGDRFGNGVIGRQFATAPDPKFGLHAGLYPESMQDQSTKEQRSWVCVNANNNYWGCTTHLSQKGGTLTMTQCKHLQSTVIPGLWAADVRLPSVVGGDLNLKYGGTPNVQDCVPAGWFRKGDGDVQHVTVTNDFTFDFSRKIGMSHTDHPAWLVAVKKS